MRGLKQLSCEERLRELRLHSLERSRLRGDLISVHLEGGCRGHSQALLSGVQCRKSRSWARPETRRLCLNIRKPFSL